MTGKEIEKRKDAAEMTGAEANIAAADALFEAVKTLRKLALDLTKRTAIEEMEIADVRLFEVCNRLKSKGERLKEAWKGRRGMTGTVKTREQPVQINEVMELTGFSRSYIYKLVHWHRLPCHKPTNGRLFFYESEILDFLSRGKKSADYELEEQAAAIMSGIGRKRY